MKKILLLFYVLPFLLLSSAPASRRFAVNELETVTVQVGERLNCEEFDPGGSNKFSDLFELTYDGLYAKKEGSVIATLNKRKFLICVVPPVYQLLADAKLSYNPGEEGKINLFFYPEKEIDFDDVRYLSTNPDVLEVRSDGCVRALAQGASRVIINYREYTTELTFFIFSGQSEEHEKSAELEIQDKNVSCDTLQDAMEGLIGINKNSLVGINTKIKEKLLFGMIQNEVIKSVFASGIIYKMDVEYENKDSLKGITSLKEITDREEIKNFTYYVITNRHLVVVDKDNITVSVGEDKPEIPATVIAWDDKIDLAVLKFSSRYYLPPAKLGTSVGLKKGEFIVSMGCGGKDNLRSFTFGVISAPLRYVTVDTDDDNINDWDSEYIQHDASVNESDSGGAIINMRGEVIGINSTRVYRNAFNNLSFAIPIDLVKDIVAVLEKGKKIERPRLGVQILDVFEYQRYPELFKERYPDKEDDFDRYIPKDLKYGFYVTEVEEGVAKQAGVLEHDIIVAFNGKPMHKSYEIRAELGKFIIGSGAAASIKVLRNNEEKTLSVRF